MQIFVATNLNDATFHIDVEELGKFVGVISSLCMTLLDPLAFLLNPTMGLDCCLGQKITLGVLV